MFQSLRRFGKDASLEDRCLHRTAVAVTLLCIVNPVRAELVPQLDLYTGYDDNIYRLPDAAALAGSRSRSDMLYGAKVGLAAPLLLGQWVGALTGDASYTWHSRNESLDYFGYHLRAAIEQKTPLWDLSFAAQSEAGRTSFSDVRALDKNIQTRQMLDAAASQTILGNFRVAGMVRGIRSTHSLPTLEGNDVDRATGSLGLGYYSPTKSFLVLEYTATQAESPRDGIFYIGADPFAFRNSYTEEGAGLRVHWERSVATMVEGRVGYTRHDDKSFLENDVDGITGSLLLRWRPRDSIIVSLRGVRDFQTENTLYSNGIRVSTLELSAGAAMARYWKIGAGTAYQTRKFDSAALNLSGTAADRTQRFEISLDYAPPTRWGLSLSLERTQRDARTPSGSYDDNMALLTVVLKANR